MSFITDLYALQKKQGFSWSLALSVLAFHSRCQVTEEMFGVEFPTFSAGPEVLLEQVSELLLSVSCVF